MSKEHGPTVYIIDDDPGLRKSLLMLLESSAIAAVAFASAEEFLAEGKATDLGCIVLDLRMPGMGGLELLHELRKNQNDIPVILISAHADVPDAVRGMKLGAIDVLQKPVESAALIEAVRRSLALADSLHAQRAESQSARQRFEHLTAREMELLNYIVEGQSNKQIAIKMHISVKTVANHRASLMSKSGAANAADLARLYTIFNNYKKTQPPLASAKV